MQKMSSKLDEALLESADLISEIEKALIRSADVILETGDHTVTDALSDHIVGAKVFGIRLSGVQ